MRERTAFTIRAPKVTSNRFWLLVASLILVPMPDGDAADLVVEPVDAARVRALSLDRAAWATAENDLGEVADDLQFSHLTVVLKRSSQQQDAFELFLKQQQDPASPNFHRWLTPVEVGE